MEQTLTLASPDARKTGAVYWIDHYVLNSEDVPRWAAFNEQLLGAYAKPATRGVFQKVGPCIIGAFEAPSKLPPGGELGHGLPRYAYYIDRADIAAHLQRLDAQNVKRGDPVHLTSDGDAGTAIYWQDPDGNQFEFWAADQPPDGALDVLSSERVGRLSHVVFESRDLERTAGFFKTYCEVDGVRTASDTVVLPLAGGARIIYKKVDKLGGRTGGMELSGAHTAMTVHQDAFIPNYRRLWAGLPYVENDPAKGAPTDAPESLPARYVRHTSPEGRRFHALTGKGDDFYDWDTNLLHFVGGTPVNGMAVYEGHTVGDYMAAWEAEHGTLDGFREMLVG